MQQELNQRPTVVFTIEVTHYKHEYNHFMVHIAQRHRQGHCFESLLLCGDDGWIGIRNTRLKIVVGEIT